MNTRTNFVKALMDKWRQQDWKRDIESYYRLRAMYQKGTSAMLRDYCRKGCEAIKARWPNHAASFDPL